MHWDVNENCALIASVGENIVETGTRLHVNWEGVKAAMAGKGFTRSATAMGTHFRLLDHAPLATLKAESAHPEHSHPHERWTEEEETALFALADANVGTANGHRGVDWEAVAAGLEKKGYSRTVGAIRSHSSHKH